MNRLSWHSKRLLYKLNYFGLTAVALVILACMTQALAISPREQKLEELEFFLTQRESTLHRLEKVRVQRKSNPIEIKSQLLGIESLPQTLRQLQLLAHQKGLVIPHFEYQLEREGNLYRYRINAEASSSYKILRGFIHDALKTFPLLSLDNIEIQTSDTQSQPVTRLEMSLYFAQTSISVATQGLEQP